MWIFNFWPFYFIPIKLNFHSKVKFSKKILQKSQQNRNNYFRYLDLPIFVPYTTTNQIIIINHII